MSMLPAVRDDGSGLTPRQLARAGRAQRSTELQIFEHGLAARYKAEVDRIDSQALADAARAALEEEFVLLDYGMARAGTSAARLELVSRKLNILSGTNNARLSRRFGG